MVRELMRNTHRSWQSSESLTLADCRDFRARMPNAWRAQIINTFLMKECVMTSKRMERLLTTEKAEKEICISIFNFISICMSILVIGFNIGLLI